MLNPNEQAKGGFGAQAARQDEQRQERERAIRAEYEAAAAAGAPVVGARPPVPRDAEPAKAARQVKRWR